MRLLNYKKIEGNRSAGFSLIEMMVATAIFTTVSIVAIGAVFTINDANRKAQAIRAVVDNLNLSLESMSRKLMAGNNYECGGGDRGDVFTSPPGMAKPCTGSTSTTGDYSVAFITSERLIGEPTARQGGATLLYRLVGQDVLKCRPESTGCVGSAYCLDSNHEKEPSCRGRILSSWRRSIAPLDYVDVIMTPPEVNIQDLRFSVLGTASGEQPRVVMTIAGEIDLIKENLKTSFNLQTTVSQRKIQ